MDWQEEESGVSLSTVKARTKKTNGGGPRKVGLAMAFKLLLTAQDHWRRLNAPHLVALVNAGVEFPDGEADVFDFDSGPQEEPEQGHLLTHTPSAFAGSEASIHQI